MPPSLRPLQHKISCTTFHQRSKNMLDVIAIAMIKIAMKTIPMIFQVLLSADAFSVVAADEVFGSLADLVVDVGVICSGEGFREPADDVTPRLVGVAESTFPTEDAVGSTGSVNKPPRSFKAGWIGDEGEVKGNVSDVAGESVPLPAVPASIPSKSLPKCKLKP